jgi:hypothetical protein
MTLGDYPLNYNVNFLLFCGNDRLLFSLEVEKYSFDSPGVGYIDIDEEMVFVPEPYYSSVAKVLNVGPGGRVSCDIDIDFVFTFGTQELHITPDDYVDRYYQNKTGECFADVFSADKGRPFVLPYTSLRDHCILYDYEQHAVGFADRIKN